MGPGIYRDLSFEDYKAIPALNHSILKWGQPPGGSMLHLKAAVDGALDDGDTPDRKFGRAVHVRLLEPDRYKSEILIADRCCATKKSGERCANRSRYRLPPGEWYCGTHRPSGAVEPVDFIDEDEAERIEQMAKALHAHDCQRLFRSPGWSEVSVVWEYRGHEWKARLDRMSQDLRLILDLKKVQRGNVHKEAIERAVLKYGYHRQAAMYIDGIGFETGVEYRFAWVFIEDSPPYDVGVLRASEEVLDVGRFEYRHIIDNWIYATKKGKFDGSNPIPRRIQSVDDLECGGLPGWYLDTMRNIETGRSYLFDGGDSEGGE